MRKFTSDPALIMFLGSINIAFNFLVAPYASWKSDRIWTLAGMSNEWIQRRTGENRRPRRLRGISNG